MIRRALQASLRAVNATASNIGTMTMDPVLYRGISVSPETPDAPLGYCSPALNLNQLVPGRYAELANVLDQTEFERLLRRQMNVADPLST